MNLDVKIRYEERYLPTKRHRIPRTREVEELVSVDLRELKKENAPVAMVVTDYKSYLDENGKNQYGLRDVSFHAIEGHLYSEKRDMWGALDKGLYSMKDFVREIERHGNCLYSWVGKSKEEVLRSVNAYINSHVMIDGVIHEQANEPRYVVQTFGLGHNHGGTAMSITTRYNPNISKDSYFTALERNKAIVYADKVAAARGDTKDVGTFGRDINITVYMPEMVRCNPQMEHGDGNAFINAMEGLVQGSGSEMEAGLLVMSAVSAQFSDNKQSFLEEQVQSSSACSIPSQPISRMKAINIEWDVDCQEDLESLPTEIEIPEGMEDKEDISDYLSDVTGFCHKGFCLVESEMKSVDDLIQSASTHAAEYIPTSHVKAKEPEPEI